MKKRFWTRLVSAVVTMAMVFSILAMPASAAGSDPWAVGVVPTQTLQGEVVYAWWATECMKDQMLAIWNDRFQSEYGYPTDENVAKAVADMKEEAAMTPDTLICNNAPEGAYMGYSQEPSENDKILWFTKDDTRKMVIAETQSTTEIFNWDEGTCVIGDNVFYAIGYKQTQATEEDFAWVVVVPANEIVEGTEAGMYAWVPAKIALKLANPDLDLTQVTVEQVKQWKSTAAASAEIKDINYGNQVFCGLSNGNSDINEVYWFGLADITAMDEAVFNASVENVTYTLNSEGKLVAKGPNGEVIATATPLNGAAISVPSTPSSSGGASGDGASLAIVAAGAAAVAATGIYFYTHPEKVQEIKDWFAGLKAAIQQKVDALTGSARGFGEAGDADEQETPEVQASAEAQAVPVDSAA